MVTVVLCGLSACGKTFFGKQAAAKLNVPFIDTDRVLEDADGRGLSCREIYARDGEEAFRSVEKHAVCVIPRDAPLVVATGGGTLLDDDNARILQEIGTLVYLKADPKRLLDRLLDAGHLNYLNVDNLEDAYHKIAEVRRPIYERYAAHHIDTATHSSEEVVEAICAIAKEKSNGK